MTLHVGVSARPQGLESAVGVEMCNNHNRLHAPALLANRYQKLRGPGYTAICHPQPDPPHPVRPRRGTGLLAPVGSRGLFKFRLHLGQGRAGGRFS